MVRAILGFSLPWLLVAAGAQSYSIDRFTIAGSRHERRRIVFGSTCTSANQPFVVMTVGIFRSHGWFLLC